VKKALVNEKNAYWEKFRKKCKKRDGALLHPTCG
jgi:hypothetical protein